VTYWLKACPRCGGDMELVREPMMGTYVTCMQCANVLTAREEAHLRITGSIPAAVTAEAPPPVLIEGRRRSA
jgi:uncharacterized Zn finger protein